MVVSRGVLVLVAALLAGCGMRLSGSGAPAGATSAALAPAAVNPQFIGSDLLPRDSLDGPRRPRPSRTSKPSEPPPEPIAPQEDEDL